MSASEALFDRAKRVLAGGVSRDTILRSPHPIYVDKGRGCMVTDIEGKVYTDFVNNMASLVHGHAFPPVVEAVKDQLARGTCFTLGTSIEVEFAEHMSKRSAAFERIRFVNSGTEAVMAAVKAARAYSGRPKIAKVEGAYHGAYDYVEVSQTPGPDRWGPVDAPAAVALAAGTPQAVADDVIVIPFNDEARALHILNQHRDSVAGVLIDLIPHRVGVIPATSSFVRALREWTRQNGALLIFDEVITFRTEVGGAQARYDVAPDITALGKAIGGGFPVGAVAGRSDVMSVFTATPEGVRLPLSGTFSANPVTMTAGLVAMQHFDEAAVRSLNKLGDDTREALTQAIRLADVPGCVTGAGSMFRIHLREQAPTNYREAYVGGDAKAQLGRFVDRMLDSGFILANTGMGTLSTAMHPGVVDQLAEAVRQVLRDLRR